MNAYGFIDANQDAMDAPNSQLSAGYNRRETVSEFDHYERVVRRNNFVQLVLDNYEADKFIATHLYGAIEQLDFNASYDDLDNFFETSAVNLSTTFEKRAHKIEKEVKQVRKMSPRETYMTLIKGYCATAILLLPKTF